MSSHIIDSDSDSEEESLLAPVFARKRNAASFSKGNAAPLSIFKEERKQNKQKIPRVSVPRVSFESMTGMGKTTGLDLASPRPTEEMIGHIITLVRLVESTSRRTRDQNAADKPLLPQPGDKLAPRLNQDPRSNGVPAPPIRGIDAGSRITNSKKSSIWSLSGHQIRTYLTKEEKCLICLSQPQLK